MEGRKNKFTKTEKSWIMYDWANSVYATNVMAVLFPIYFAIVCEKSGADNVVLWSYGTSAATFLVALSAPILGALADHKGFKKKLFTIFLAIGAGFTFSNVFFNDYRMLLLGYVMSHIGFSGANLFYDSFLTDVTTSERMDRVSSWGYAMGYIGGSTIPFIISIVILFTMGMENPQAFRLVLILTSAWWIIFSIPILKNVKQVHYIETPPTGLVKSTFSNLARTAKSIFMKKHLLVFILAYFFYIDGVGTVISISTSYGSKLGLDSISMIIALLLTQIVAVPFSILFGKLSAKFGSIKMLKGAVGVYMAVCLTGFFMGFNIEQNEGSEAAMQLSLVLFWAMAFLVGTVQGGIQAISRSYFGKLIPKEHSNEYFGFFDIFGKFAAVIGPLMIAIFADITGRSSIGVLSLLMLFIIAMIILTVGGKYLKAAEKEMEN
jgi:Permeases of the major facilitator superfamily